MPPATARPQRWDPLSGRLAGELPHSLVRRSAGGAKAEQVTSVELRLAPFESCFVVFGSDAAAPLLVETDARGQWEIARKGATGRAARPRARQPGSYAFRGPGRTRRVTVGSIPAVAAVHGPWTLALGTRSPVRLERLRPWSEVSGGKGFSGWGSYETHVDVPDLGEEIDWFVDLGEVHETAHVFLNGQDLGAAWHGRRRLACGPAIARGSNHLRIDVANLWIHYVLAHPPGDPARLLKGIGEDRAVAETAGIRWGTYGEVPPEQVPASGLLGPVAFVPMKRVRVPL